MFKCCLLGYGEIGQAVHEVFSPYHQIDINDIKFKDNPLGDYDILLVAIPYTADFVNTVKAWACMYKVKATIIFSTVAIGTTAQIPNAVHSPVEGKHPELTDSIRWMQRWVGGWNKTVEQFFDEVKYPKQKRYATKPDITEAIKLLSTSLYGINIEFARYAKSVLGDYYGLFEAFNWDYNNLYRYLDLPQFQRYILTAPKGNIGGHCVVPNAKILDEQHPSILLKEIYRDKEGSR